MANKLEAKFQTKFGKWLKHNWASSSAFELKIARGKFHLNQIKEHQARNLRIANSSLLYYKISDADFCSQKPFDTFTLFRVPAFVVIQWASRGNKKFYLLDIKQVESLIKKGIKSLTEEDADKYAAEVGELA